MSLSGDTAEHCSHRLSCVFSDNSIPRRLGQLTGSIESVPRNLRVHDSQPMPKEARLRRSCQVYCLRGMKLQTLFGLQFIRMAACTPMSELSTYKLSLAKHSSVRRNCYLHVVIQSSSVLSCESGRCAPPAALRFRHHEHVDEPPRLLCLYNIYGFIAVEYH